MALYGDYTFVIDEICLILEPNKLEFLYWIVDSSDEFICEITALLGKDKEITFPAFFISHVDLKHGSLDEFADFVFTNLTLSRLVADLCQYLGKPLPNISTGTPPKAA